jgi:hypothetical protein
MTNNKKIYTGPNGGKYTLSKTGKKEYIGRVARGLRKKKEVSRNGASDARKWQLHLPKNTHYCGPAGGAAKTSYPVNTEKRCRAALSYARFAKRPCGIVGCALAQAKRKGWDCGKSSTQAKSCKCRNCKK